MFANPANTRDSSVCVCVCVYKWDEVGLISFFTWNQNLFGRPKLFVDPACPLMCPIIFYSAWKQLLQSAAHASDVDCPAVRRQSLHAKVGFNVFLISFQLSARLSLVLSLTLFQFTSSKKETAKEQTSQRPGCHSDTGSMSNTDITLSSMPWIIFCNW